MKAYLMYADRDFRQIKLPDPGQKGIVPDLIQDLELDTLWDGMGQGDDFLRRVAQSALLSSLTSIDEIRFRQYVMADCIAQPAIVRDIYALAVEAITAEHQVFRSIFAERGEALMRRSVEVIQMFVGMLRRLRQITEEHAEKFQSPGFQRFFAQLRAELDDAYFDEIEEHLKTLRFREGVVLSARLGDGNRGVGYLLRSPKPENRGSWYNRTLLKKPTYAFSIPDRDEAGFRALADLRDRGLNLVANALGHAADHVLSFFIALRTELGFYVGALNLYERLAAAGEPVCFPDPAPPEQLKLTARQMYDPCLVLRTGRKVIGNNLDADGKDLIVITGANQGGKSTFLRSLGLAHLMMQTGMFTPAESLSSTVTLGVFTHYKREEDATMSGGKFDEELARMSIIADQITPHCLLMCNESFAATNEREGSDIAAEVIRAMNDAAIRVVFVTHMYDLSRRYEDQHTDRTLFLRADRDEGGQRSYRLQVAPPLPTSYGEDLYRRTFYPDGSGDASAPTADVPDRRGESSSQVAAGADHIGPEPDSPDHAAHDDVAPRDTVEADAVGALPQDASHLATPDSDAPDSAASGHSSAQPSAPAANARHRAG
jgi:DNA mismatch repair ATPase MutS